jgi:hypothetical protein
MRRVISIAAIAVALALSMLTGCPSGERGTPVRNTLATAEETVRAYCELDANGTRLTSATWSKMLPYIGWQEEAGWDRAVVISGFSVEKPATLPDQTALVTVEYQVLGILSQDYAPSRKTETVRFQVKKTGAGWKIMDPDFLPPHVRAEAIIRHLEETKNLEAARKIAEKGKE